MLKVRKTTKNDLNKIDEIFLCAKEYMKKSGNKSQWASDYPNSKDTLIDIDNDCSYVIIDENDDIVGTFALITSEDPNYKIIKDGKWLNDDKYVTIHRIASNMKRKGVFKTALGFAKTYNLDIRIDTHIDNKTMIHLIENNGFKYCGIVYMKDKTERLAYQLCKKY